MATLRALLGRLIDVPPHLYPDPADHWRARTVCIFVVTYFGTLPLFALSLLLCTPETVRYAAVSVPGGLVIYGLAYLITRYVRGGTRIAGWLLVPTLVLAMLATAARGFGIFDSNALCYYWLLVLATLLLGARAALLTTGAAIVALLWLGTLTLQGRTGQALPPLPRTTIEIFTQTTVSVAINIGVSLFLWERLHRTLVRRAEEQGRASQAAEERAARLQEVAQLRREAAEQKDLLARLIVHELRSPLTVVKAAGQLAAMAPDLERARPQLDRIEAGAARMEGLLDDLADSVRLQQNRLVLTPEPCDLGQLCTEAAQVAASAAGAAGRTVALSVPAEPLVASADPRRVSQILGNLLGNALRYSPPEAGVRLALRAEGGGAVVAVSDDGPGIPEEERARIFQSFYQVPGAERFGGGTGLGLGLYLCKELVERHGGRIWVESEVGRGSTFFFLLPLEG